MTAPVRGEGVGPDLLAALIEARSMIEEWAGYASPYFQEKHGLAEDLASIDAVIAEALKQRIRA